MKKETILLVEDEQGIRELIQLYLANRAYTVLPAESGKSCFKTDAEGTNRPHFTRY